MKTKLITAAVAAATLISVGARGQSTTPVITPSPAPSVGSANATIGAPATVPNQIVYAPRLPSASELSNAAAAQGLAIERIEQTSTQVTAVYKYSNGQINTVVYQIVPPAGAPNVATQTVASAPAPTVVYERAPRVVYYDDYYDPYYTPRYWYPPVSFNLGFGYGYRNGGHYHNHHWRR